MKLQWCLVAIVLFSVISEVARAGSPFPGYKLVWSDEFKKDGAPDPNNWNFESGFVRNKELQWYQPENATVKNGKLTIEVSREQKPNPNYDPTSSDWKKNRKYAEYTSSSLTTLGKHSWTYGQWVMRAKIDTRTGMWPAFWTVGAQGEWPSGGEIDIMEFYDSRIRGNVAWGTGTRWNAAWNSVAKPISEFNNPNWSNKFHIWRMDWDKDWIKLYVDNTLINTTDLSKTINADDSNPFHSPQSIILNFAVGQNGGDPSQTTFPAQFVVDYIRIYQKADTDK